MPVGLNDLSLDESLKIAVVHPLVVLNVLDHFTRRPAQNSTGRVIGTLLGRRDGDSVEITNSFSVPHAENGDEVAIGKDFNKTMLALHQRTNRKEVVVGWYATASSTGDLVTETTSLIHDFYSSETEDGAPVHLVFDTQLASDGVSVRALCSQSLELRGEQVGSLFQDLKLVHYGSDPVRSCLNEMVNTTDGRIGAQDGLRIALRKIDSMLGNALAYVTSHGENGEECEEGIDKKLADLVALVPRIDREMLVYDSMQDLLMISYLSNATKTQIALAEKLNNNLV